MKIGKLDGDCSADSVYKIDVFLSDEERASWRGDGPSRIAHSTLHGWYKPCTADPSQTKAGRPALFGRAKSGLDAVAIDVIENTVQPAELGVIGC